MLINITQNCLLFFRKFAFLALSILCAPLLWADASDSCNNTFVDAVGASTDNGAITIGYNSVIYGNPDTELNASFINYNSSQPIKTCDSDHCSASTSPFTPFSLPSFETHSGGSDYYVSYQSSMSFDGAVTNIKSIGMDSQGQLDMAAPSGGVYKIGSLNIGDRAVVNFAAGDYYIENFATVSEMQLNIIGPGTVRIFVKNNAYINSYGDFNSPSGLEGDPGKLFFIFYDGVTFNSQTNFSGYLYSVNTFTSQSHNEFWGSIVADEIWLSSSVNVYFRDPSTAATTPSFVDVCTYISPALVANFTFDEIIASDYPDESGNGYLGTPDSSTQIINPGQVCQSIDIPYDSTKSFVGVETDIDSSEITETGSVALWVNLDSDWDAFSDRRTIFYAKKSNRFIDVSINKQGRLTLELKDSSNTTLGANSTKTGFTSGQWHHIVVTWNLSNTIDVKFYIDGVIDTTSITSTSAAWSSFTGLSNYDELYLFDRRANDNGPKYSLDGQADELYFYNYEIDATQVTALMNDTRATCSSSAATLDHFDISFTSTGSTCPGFASAITIKAMDATNTEITNYEGTINLTASSEHGTWSINNADGVVTDSTLDDGLASYTFLTSDEGVIVLDLENTHADTSIISIEDTIAAVTSTSSNISFADNIFLVEPDTLQIAGKDLGIKVTLIATDASNNQCGVATDYNQAKIKGWYDPLFLLTGNDAPRLNNTKLKSPEPNAHNETFNFVNGVANIVLTNDNVGQFVFYVSDEVSGYAKDENGDELKIEGQSSTITLRPFALAMDFDNDADTADRLSVDANGSIFKSVDETFTLTVTPVLWDSNDDLNNDGVVDIGADLTDNDDIPSFDDTNESIEITATHLLPAGGSVGTLSGTTSSDDYSSDDHDYVLSYSEVGIISLSAEITNNGFLNNGDGALTTLTNIGRFIPDHFSLSANSVNLESALAACYITYQGQDLTLDSSLDFTFTALDSSNNPLNNYSGDFNKFDISDFEPTLTRTVATLGFASDPTVDWNAPVMSDHTNFDGDWVVSISANSLQYPKLNATPSNSDLPFSAALNGYLSAGLLDDSDGVCLDTGSGCTDFKSLDISGSTIIYGATFLQNSFQSEMVDALMSVELKIWALQDNLSDFYTITVDSCSTVDITDFEFLSCTEHTGSWCDANYQSTLTSSHNWQTIDSGEGELAINSPGENNTGRVQIQLNVPDYLQFDYLGNGVAAPTATINFGINNTNDSIIFMQEQYR